MNSFILLGHLQKVIAYKYRSNDHFIVKDYKFDVNKKYAYVYPKNIYLEIYSKPILQVVSHLDFDTTSDNMIEKMIKDSLYIYDDINICNIIKNILNLEDYYDYPQFLIEYEYHISEDIRNIEGKKKHYDSILNHLCNEKISIENKILYNLKELKTITTQEKEIEEKMNDIYSTFLPLTNNFLDT
jgi:hypothetical protein